MGVGLVFSYISLPLSLQGEEVLERMVCVLEGEKVGEGVQPQLLGETQELLEPSLIPVGPLLSFFAFRYIRAGFFFEAWGGCAGSVWLGKALRA